jgi:hypothetical protein
MDSNNPSAFCDAAVYCPLWDVHPLMWTDEAIKAGVRTIVTTDKREIIAPINIVELYADGFVTAGGMRVRNASLGGLNAAGPPVGMVLLLIALLFLSPGMHGKKDFKSVLLMPIYFLTRTGADMQPKIIRVGVSVP